MNRHDPKVKLKLSGHIHLTLHRVVSSEDVFAMYTIERLADQGWTKEITCNTEFKAFINARTKCMATGRIYRVINSCRQVECVITVDDCKRQFRAI